MSIEYAQPAPAARSPASFWPGEATATRRLTQARLVDIAIGLLASAFLMLALARHAMWRDELNAWGLVLDSRTLGDLFAHLHYEGHPGLWHLLLWFASGISTAPQTLQVVHGIIALGIVWMVVLASPFSRFERVLILCNYFVLFDYTVVSRNYGIALLLALAYAQRRVLHPDQLRRNAVLLGLLANTNVFALMLAGACGLEYAISRYRDRANAAAWLVPLLAPAAILLAFAGLSVATFWPAADISWRTTGRPLANGLSLDELAYVVTNNLSALVPLDVQAFWYSEQGPKAIAYPALRLAIFLSTPLLVMALWRIFRRERRLLLVPALTFAGAVAFNLVFYEGSIRHWGINFVAFLTVLWILRATHEERTPWATPLLALGAAAGLVFTVQHWTIPFSSADATADWIRQQGLQDAALVGTPDTHVAAVAELLGRPITFLDCQCTDTYLAYNRRRDEFAKHQIPERLARSVATGETRPVLYLNNTPATREEEAALNKAHLTLQPRAAFTGALNENFYVYAVVKRPDGVDPAAETAPAAAGADHAPALPGLRHHGWESE